MQFKHQQDTHAITQYIKFCEKQRFNHLSESTLYQILKGLKPSQRKILQNWMISPQRNLINLLCWENIEAIYGKENWNKESPTWISATLH